MAVVENTPSTVHPIITLIKLLYGRPNFGTKKKILPILPIRYLSAPITKRPSFPPPPPSLPHEFKAGNYKKHQKCPQNSQHRFL